MMINDITYCYDEIIDDIDMLDKKENQILCFCDLEQHTHIEWIQLLKKIKNAEVSLFLNSNLIFYGEMYRYCCLNNIIIYVDLDTFVELNFGDDCRGVELVLCIDNAMLKKISSVILKKIVEKDCHICIINGFGNIKTITDFYLMLLADGFSNLFSLASLSNSQLHPREYHGLINQSMLENFRTERNIYIRDEIEQLKKNAQ